VTVKLPVILLVEDNPDDVELTLRAFNRSQIANQIVVAEDGLEALDYLFGRSLTGRDGAKQPQVVLLDLKLPKLDGIEVLLAIRADPRTHRLPVVVLTSSDEEEDLQVCYDLGCSSYVRKPVSFEELVEAARQLASYWLVLNRPAPSLTRQPAPRPLAAAR
jgi:two-component system, response regulator